jgi:hypothetical protein
MRGNKSLIYYLISLCNLCNDLFCARVNGRKGLATSRVHKLIVDEYLKPNRQTIHVVQLYVYVYMQSVHKYIIEGTITVASITHANVGMTEFDFYGLT